MALLAQQGFSRGPKRFPKVSKAATTVPQSIPKGAIIGLLDQQGFSSGPKRSQASYNDSQQQQQQQQQQQRRRRRRQGRRPLGSGRRTGITFNTDPERRPRALIWVYVATLGPVFARDGGPVTRTAGKGALVPVFVA